MSGLGPRASGRRRALASLSILGVALTAAPLLHLTLHSLRLQGVLVTVVAPLLMAGTLIAAGPVLSRRDLSVASLRRIRRWVALGLVTGAVIGVGTVVHLTSSQPLLGPDLFIVANIAIAGAVAGLGIGHYDAIARQRADSLARSTATFQGVFEGSHDALLVVDGADSIVDANPAAAALYGIARADLVGRRPGEFTAPDVDWAATHTAMQEGALDHGEGTVLRPGGEARTVEVTATSEVSPGHHLIALRDVTERVAAQRTLDDQHETVALLSQILRHDVRNGVQVILGHTDRLTDLVDGTAAASVAAIQDRTERIATLIDRVQAITRSVRDGDPLEAVPIGETLTSVLEGARSAHPEATVTGPEAVPADLTVTADGMLGTVFENLVGNALAHSDSDAPTVAIDVARDDETVTVSVADSGPGIPETTLETIFEPGAARPGSTGMGLGLHIVRTLVSRYGGTIDVRPNEPRGSVFEVALPRADRPTAAAPKRHP